MKNCFLAFLCLYRSKAYGIRKRVVDHPYGSRAGNPRPSAPSFLQRWIHYRLYPAHACPAASRIRAVTDLGSKYPRSLSTVLWLASLALTVRGTYDRNVGIVILNAVKNLPLLREGDPSPPQASDQDDVHLRSFPRCKSQIINTAIDRIVGAVTLSEAKSILPLRVGRSPANLRDRLSPPQATDTIDRYGGIVILNAVKNLPLLREGDPSPPQATDQDDVHLRSFPRCKSQIINNAIDLIRERLLMISFRSAKVLIKGLPYQKLSLKDGSRHVCMPSYLKPREFP
ncbi:hypothetical protein A33Q_4029 [Indibacter alkaliphilus LW1]|uniref:Uncharacterized protein n=2 Tax=Indibacter TaxID=647744 RepID=S2DIZ3_INDAL|nr:hypothetical protein A33Q_4029 [Indibacter alkaliphilus LW1]